MHFPAVCALGQTAAPSAQMTKEPIISPELAGGLPSPEERVWANMGLPWTLSPEHSWGNDHGFLNRCFSCPKLVFVLFVLGPRDLCDRINLGNFAYRCT